MLKPGHPNCRCTVIPPAAFGRLCVETGAYTVQVAVPNGQPPSGGCVLKQVTAPNGGRFVEPAAFGRLCVETIFNFRNPMGYRPAAFGRLCVETAAIESRPRLYWASRLRAAVC